MMLHPCYNTRTMLRNNAQQCTNMIQQQTMMWRWCNNEVLWCILMCNIMFICYNNVPMYLMIWRLNKHCNNVVQQCTIMFTNDQQCYIMLKHFCNAVTMMRNIMLRCANNVTMYNNADPSYNNLQQRSHMFRHVYMILQWHALM